MEFCQAVEEGCLPTCPHGKKCLKMVDFEIVGQLRNQFWGKIDDSVKMPKERAIAIESVYKTCEAFQVNISRIKGGSPCARQNLWKF